MDWGEVNCVHIAMQSPDSGSGVSVWCREGGRGGGGGGSSSREQCSDNSLEKDGRAVSSAHMTLSRDVVQTLSTGCLTQGTLTGQVELFSRSGLWRVRHEREIEIVVLPEGSSSVVVTIGVDPIGRC